MSKKVKMESYCVADAVSFGLSEIESLRDELSDWYDNMKGNTLQESIEALSQGEYMTVPSCVEEGVDASDDTENVGCVGHLRFEVRAMQKRRMSRRARRDLACAVLNGALDAIRGALEESTAGDELDPYEETRDEIESFCDELENAIDAFDNAEFPGMYG